MKRIKTYLKISLESIDRLTRIKSSIDSSQLFDWLVCTVSSNAENVKKNNPTLGTKHSHAGNKTALRLALDDITARAPRHYGSCLTTLRLVVTLFLMMVVGVSGVKADDLPFTVTTDATSPNYYLIQSAQIPSFYMIPYSTSNNVSTSNVPCADMRWYFMDAGIDNTVQYYYIIHTSGKYLCNGAEGIQLADAGTTDSYKFIIEATGEYYYIKSKGESASYVTKVNGNVNPTDYVKANATADGANSKWKFIASNDIPKPVPFTLSTDLATTYYKIRNKSFSAYYLSTKPEISATMVCTTRQESDNMVWYFKQASSDSYLTYYYIINAETGKYMCFDATAQTASLQDKTTENDEACQFVIVQTARTQGSGSNQKVYAIIPKSLKAEIWGNNSIALKDDKNGTNVYVNNDRTDTYARAHWTFEPVSPCADPVISFDETEGKVTLTSATLGASIYYTTSTTDAAPDDPTATTGTLYTDGIILTNNAKTTIKAIAIKGYGKSQVTDKTIYYMPTFTLTGGPYTYDGTAKEPTVSGVTIGTTPIAATDYVVEYKDNIDAGTATVILREAKGKDYMIYGSQTFSITAKAMTMNSGANFAAGFSVVVKENDILALYDGDKELVANTDYEIVGNPSTSGQTTTRTIHPKGNYSGDDITLSNTSGITFHTDALKSEWSATFVSGANYGLPDESVNAFIITGIQGEWAIAKLLPYIPSGVPVLVVSNKETNGFLVGTPSGEAPDCSANMLEFKTEALPNVVAGKIYWLYNNEFVLNMAGEIPAGKVFLNPNNFDDSQLTGGSSTPTPAPARLSIRRAESTGIYGMMDSKNDGISGQEYWYTLDGRRLNGKPTQKGLYITKNRKVIIK